MSLDTTRESAAGTAVADEAQFCTFKVADLLVGIDVQRVQEVIRFQDMTPVPLASDEVRGLINLRGQIVTAIDLRHTLGLPARDEDAEAPMNAVIRCDEEAVSLLVDEAGDVVEPPEHDFEPIPSTVPAQLRALASGAYKLDGTLLLVLDAERIIRHDSESSAPAAAAARPTRSHQ